MFKTYLRLFLKTLNLKLLLKNKQPECNRSGIVKTISGLIEWDVELDVIF